MARTEGGGPSKPPKPPKPKTPTAPARGKGDNSRGRALHEARNAGVKASTQAGRTLMAERKLQALRRPSLMPRGWKPDADTIAAARGLLSPDERKALRLPSMVPQFKPRTIKDTGDPRGVEVSPNIFMPRDERGWPYYEIQPGVFVAKDPRGSWKETVYPSDAHNRTTGGDTRREWVRPAGPQRLPRGMVSPYSDKALPELLNPDSADPLVSDEDVRDQALRTLDAIRKPKPGGLLDDLLGLRPLRVEVLIDYEGPLSGMNPDPWGGVFAQIGREFIRQQGQTIADRWFRQREEELKLLDQIDKLNRKLGDFFPTAPVIEKDDFKWLPSGKGKAFSQGISSLGSGDWPAMQGPGLDLPAPGTTNKAPRASDAIDMIIKPRSLFGMGDWPVMPGPAAGSSSAPSDDPSESRWLERWVTGNTNTCPRCASLSGRVFWSDEGPTPQIHDHCGCERVRV